MHLLGVPIDMLGNLNHGQMICPSSLAVLETISKSRKTSEDVKMVSFFRANKRGEKPSEGF